jgi:uncharacterized protein (DUF2235 family)
MSKNIVFCADGTWNGPGEADHDDKNSPATNVFKLFLKLDGVDAAGTTRLEKEQERVLADAAGEVVQIAKYLHGVGDSDNFLEQKLGGAFGAGLITRIVRGYTFVSRNYVAGDRVYLIGFSRGAYTARALAGLISAKGLLDAAALGLDDKELAYRLGSQVWYRHRQEALRAAKRPLDHLQEIAFDLPAFLSARRALPPLVDAPIEAVAVWDTVGSLGIPEFRGQHAPVDVFQFANRTLSPNIKFGRHAVSIDERRNNFVPTLWDPDPRVKQVLFPGAHADVGSGYTTSGNQSGLSDVALRWMTAELTVLGIVFAELPTIVESPNPAGTAHRPWTEGVWPLLGSDMRELPGGLGLSQSVIDRINAGPVVPDPGDPAEAYRPANIPTYLNGNAAALGAEIVPV